jgi:hypothetical protein
LCEKKLHRLRSGGDKSNLLQPKNTEHPERAHSKRDADGGEKRVKRLKTFN